MPNLLSYPDIPYRLNAIPEGSVVAVDSETTGLSSYKGHLPFLYQFANLEGDVTIVDAGLSTNRKMLKEFFENDKITKVFHNMKFDIKMIRKDKYDIKGRFHDTLIMAKQLDAYEKSFKLEDLMMRYNEDFKALEVQQLEKWFEVNKINRKDRKYHEVPDKIMHPYGAVDAYNTIELYQVYKGPIRTVIDMYGMDMRVQDYLIDIEDRGVLIDHKKGRANCKVLKEKYDEIQKEIKYETGMKIEPTDARTVSAALFQSGCQCKKLTDKGAVSTESSTLKLYVPEAAWVKDLLKLRDTNKAWKDLRDQILGNKDSKHCLHTSFNLSQARTGRFSSTGPNLQNQKKDKRVREVFVPREGYTNFYFDYDQVEYKLFVFFSRDPKLLKQLLDPEFDVHQIRADELGIPRHDAKTFNFSILYGSGAPHLSEEFGISLMEAKALLTKYHLNNPALKTLRSQLERTLTRDGFFVDPFGKEYHVPQGEPHKFVNYLIQGTACNLFKKAMLGVKELLKGTQSHIIQLIHDEIVLEIHDDDWHLIPKIKKVMETQPKFDVALPVSIQYTRTNWWEKEDFPVWEKGSLSKVLAHVENVRLATNAF